MATLLVTILVQEWLPGMSPCPRCQSPNVLTSRREHFLQHCGQQKRSKDGEAQSQKLVSENSPSHYALNHRPFPVMPVKKEVLSAQENAKNPIYLIIDAM